MITVQEAYNIAKKEQTGRWEDPLYMDYNGKHCFCESDPAYWIFVDKEDGTTEAVDTTSILCTIAFGNSKMTMDQYDAMSAAIRNSASLKQILKTS